jgi:hypothetical protein
MSFPIIVIVPITNASYSLSGQHVRRNELGSLNLLGPAFDHRYAAIEYALWLIHTYSPSCGIITFLSRSGILRRLTDVRGPRIWLKAEQKHGGAGESRTPDLRFRKPPLYPSELQPRHQGPDSLHPSRRKVPNIPNRAIPGGRETFAAVSCIQMDHSLEHRSCARAKGKTPSIFESNYHGRIATIPGCDMLLTTSMVRRHLP